MPSKQGPLAKGLGMLRRLAPPPPAPPASRARPPFDDQIPFCIHRDAGALSATDGLRDRPQLRLRAEVVVVVEPDKLPSPRKEVQVGSSPAVTPAARARTPSEPSAARTRSEPSAARTRSEPSAARDLRSNPAGQPLKKTYLFFYSPPPFYEAPSSLSATRTPRRLRAPAPRR